jgi:hypothetical protein
MQHHELGSERAFFDAIGVEAIARLVKLRCNRAKTPPKLARPIP